MSQPSAKLFVPDQAIYWLDASTKLDKPIDKREWLKTHNLPEFADSPKEDEKTPWTRIDGIQARNVFLKNLGPNNDPTKRKLLCFTASAGVGKSIALEQIAYHRSLDPEHVVIRYHFSELPINPTHFKLAGESERGVIATGKTKTLVTALLKTIFPLERNDRNCPKLTDTYEKAMLQWIELKIAQGQVTLIVDGLDELNANLKSETGTPGSNRASALSELLYDGVYKNLHCVVAGRPYSIAQDNWFHLFQTNSSGIQYNCGSEWEFCLAALFTPDQSKRYLGKRYEKLSSLQAQTPLTPRHLEVIRTLPDDRFGNLHSLACVYWEMLQASLGKDLSREGNVGPYERLDVPVDDTQYISYLAALASLTMENSSDLLSLRLATVRGKLNTRVLQTPAWQMARDSAEEKINLIARLNSSSIEFNYLRQRDEKVAWKDRTVMEFFAALWMVRYSTAAERQTICDQVPRLGKTRLNENRRDLWTFISGMPSEALEQLDEELNYDSRWNELVQRLFQPFDDAKRPTQLMYIAWCALTASAKKRETSTIVSKANSSEKVNAKQVVGLLSLLRRFFRTLNGSKCYEFPYSSNPTRETIIHLFHQSYSVAKDGRGRQARIIREDLESQFKPIPPPEGGWAHVEVGHKDEPNNQPRTINLDGPFEVCAYPVTRRLYALFDSQHEVAFKDDLKQFSPHPRCPAIEISWYDAKMFSVWAGVRLLTEHEWEYACRANIRDGDSTSGPLSKYFWKDDPEGEKLQEHAWVDGNSKGLTWPVDAKADDSHTNLFKLVDMLGNVYEWTDSPYEAYSFFRVLRGGSFDCYGRYASSSCRNRSGPTSADVSIGFRVARAP